MLARLRDHAPAPPVQDVADHAWGDPVLTSKLRLGSLFGGRAEEADASDVGGAEPGWASIPDVLPADSGDPCSVSTLSHVGHVVDVRPLDEVIAAHAPMRSAVAPMSRLGLWPPAVQHEERDSVGKLGLTLESKAPVAIRVPGARPHVAGAQLRHENGAVGPDAKQEPATGRAKRADLASSRRETNVTVTALHGSQF